MVEELETVGESLGGGRGVTDAAGKTVDVLLHSLHRELEALEKAAHAVELLEPHGTRQIAERREQLRRQFVDLAIGVLHGLDGRARARHGIHALDELGPSPLGIRFAGEHLLAQRLEPRDSLAQGIECIQIAAQGVLRFVRQALRH